jgi:hypothetical protein
MASVRLSPIPELTDLNSNLANKWVSLTSIVDTLMEFATSLPELSTSVPKAAEMFAFLLVKLVEHNIITMNILNIMAMKNGEKDKIVK